MRVLVTGASGFIGKALCLNLYEKGHRVIGYDRHPKPIEGADEVLGGDILEFDRLAMAIHDRADAVINLAGLLGTSELLLHVKQAVDANILGALYIYEICLHQRKPLVQISPGNASWLSVYPITKMCAERLALALGADAGLKVAIVRAMNVYGPGQKHAPVRKYIPNLIRWAFLDQPAEIYGDGEQIMERSSLFLPSGRSMANGQGCSATSRCSGSSVPSTSFSPSMRTSRNRRAQRIW